MSGRGSLIQVGGSGQVNCGIQDRAGYKTDAPEQAEDAALDAMLTSML
jgi:hypothetical protein